MVAIGTRVGEHVELQRRELAVLVGACFHRHLHRMPCRCRDELLFAGELELDRPAGLERGECQDILDEHFLLAAEAAANALAKYPDLFRSQLENIGKRTPRQERYLRAGTDVQYAGRIDPGEAAMRLQCSMLDPLRGERSLIGDG